MFTRTAVEIGVQPPQRSIMNELKAGVCSRGITGAIRSGARFMIIFMLVWNSRRKTRNPSIFCEPLRIPIQGM